MDWTYEGQVEYFLEENGLPKASELPGVEEAASFLQRLTRKMAQACAEFHHVVEVLPLEGERQMQSIVLPAMHQISKAVYVEQPIATKRKGKGAGTGYIDYWVYYEQFVFLIELKVNWIGVGRKSLQPPKPISQNWRAALDQLDRISKTEAIDLAMDDKKVLKMAMLMVPSHQWFENRPEPVGRDQIAKMHAILRTGLKPQPNWCCTMAFPGQLQVVELDDDEGFDVYPSLSVMTLVKAI